MDFKATFLQFQTIYKINYYIRQLEKSCLKIPISILQLTNKAKKAIFWSKIRFFPKRYSLRMQTSEVQNNIFSIFQTCWDTLYHGSMPPHIGIDKLIPPAFDLIHTCWHQAFISCTIAFLALMYDTPQKLINISTLSSRKSG